MPLVTAQAKSYSQVDSYNTYDFAHKHKSGWMAFWEEMGGDKEKIISFAEKSGVDRPTEWFNSLYRFLFGVFCGDEDMFDGVKLTAASKDFQTFLEKTLKNHQDNPKDKWWYINKGTTEAAFIAMLERASSIEQQENEIAYINARIKDLGNELYSEFLLTKAGHMKEINSVASEMNRKAYEFEKQSGIDVVANMHVGDTVKHSLFANHKYTILEKADNVLVVKDELGRIGYVTDPWNLTVG